MKFVFTAPNGKRKVNPSSVEFWRGFVDGIEIVAVATNLQLTSENIKTGDTIQTYIMPVSTPPREAVKLGIDRAVCGDCKFRPLLAQVNKLTGILEDCYVDLNRAVHSVWLAFNRGSYPIVTPAELGEMVKASGKPFRQGSWGDPSRVEAEVWAACDTTRGMSYTHQWRFNPEMKKFSMASVDTAAEAVEAQKLGWRTYRVDTENRGPINGSEIACPNTADKSVKCADCRLCSGLRSGAKSIMIELI